MGNTFNYCAVALVDAQVTTLDPFNAPQAALTRPLSLDLTQTVLGMIQIAQASVPTGSAPTGKLIFIDKTFGSLDISGTKSPYFTMNALAQ